MPAVSITGCVLVVRSSCSFGPSRIRRATASPSACEASSSVARTAGWSPHASSMPTACDPWPGNTNANAVIATVFGSEIEEHGAPRKGAADAFEHQRVAALDLAAAHRGIQRERNRGCRSVAVLVDGDDQLVQRQLQLLGRALHDAE